MEGRIECKCGNEIIISGDTRLDDYSVKAEGGRLEEGEGFLRVVCGKCGKEAGKINFYRQVEEKG